MEVRQTDVFAEWLLALRDNEAKVRILQRIDRAGRGLLGDVSAVGGGVSEMRVHHGPGYRIYFIQRGQVLIILLSAGTKRGQGRDIRRAQMLGLEQGDP